jgi:hypothetical protein
LLLTGTHCQENWLMFTLWYLIVGFHVFFLTCKVHSPSNHSLTGNIVRTLWASLWYACFDSLRIRLVSSLDWDRNPCTFLTRILVTNVKRSNVLSDV